MYLDFNKDKTAIIKGVAIIFMIILHCSIPGNWDYTFNEFTNNYFIRFMGTLQICVGIYTFMVGYGYAFAKDKNLKYSINHIKKLLIPFWIIIFIFTLPVCFKELYWSKFILNLFGINSEYNWFSWFVTFYIFAMLIMPYLSKRLDKSPKKWIIITFTFYYIFKVVSIKLFPEYTKNDWTQRLFDCIQQLPIVVTGYIFARHKIFSKIKITHNNFNILGSFITIIVILLIRVYFSHILGFSLDFIYSTIIILCILIIANMMSSQNCILNILKLLGKTSVYMWFFHALFFTKITRNIYQGFLNVSDSFIIVTIWTIILTFFCSWIIMKIANLIEFQIMKIEK